MLQAIPLPPFSDEAIAVIGTPTPPSNPPSAMDISKAMHYSRSLLNANGMSGISLLCVLWTLMLMPHSQEKGSR